MEMQLIVAGFGGQGVLLMGQLMAYAGMLDGKEASWMPAYGPEMRGGSANCSVVISDEPVGSPKVEDADVVIAMNRKALRLTLEGVKRADELAGTRGMRDAEKLARLADMLRAIGCQIAANLLWAALQ